MVSIQTDFTSEYIRRCYNKNKSKYNEKADPSTRRDTHQTDSLSAHTGVYTATHINCEKNIVSYVWTAPNRSVFADTELYDNPSKYVMQPDSQTNVWPQSADVSAAGKYCLYPPPSIPSHSHIYKQAKHWQKLVLSPGCVSVLITVLGSLCMSEYTPRLSDLHLHS